MASVKRAFSQPGSPLLCAPLTAHRYDAAQAVAAEACGLVPYIAICPNSLTEALSGQRSGRKSVEYAPRHAVSDRHDVYDAERNAYGRRLFAMVERENLLYLREVQQEETKRVEAETEEAMRSGKYADVEEAAARFAAAFSLPKLVYVAKAKNPNQARLDMGDYADDE